MRKTALAITFILMFLVAAFLAGVNPASGDALVEDSWVALAPLPKPYYTVSDAAALDGKIYFIGEGICERYDPDANNWTAVTPPPVYYTWGAVAACQNKIYMTGGPTHVYDPTTGSWENSSSLPINLWGYKANVVNDKIYVISGEKPAPLGIFDLSDATYVYDPAADSWSTLASIPTPVSGYASAVVDNKIYIIGGTTGTSGSVVVTDMVQIFDPEKNQWTNCTRIPTGVFQAAACSTSGIFAPKRIYVVGGHYGPNLNQVYDPETAIWSSATSLPDSRWLASLVNVNDALYAVGGLNGTTSVPGNDWDAAQQLISKTRVQATWKYTPTGYNTNPSPTPSAPDGYAADLFPIILSVLVVIVAVAGLVVYHKKHNKNT